METKTQIELAKEWWLSLAKQQDKQYSIDTTLDDNVLLDTWIANGSPLIEADSKETQELSIKTEQLLNASKKDITDLVTTAVNAVKSGKADKMKSYIYAKKIESLGKELVKQLKPYADDTTIQSGGLVQYNASITQSEQGVSYDYSTTGDKEWTALNKLLEETKLAKEQREAFLKTIVKPLELVDIDTGETYTVSPPVKSGKLGVSIKIK